MNVCVCAQHVYIWKVCIHVYVFEGEWDVCEYSVCMLCVSEVVCV